MMPDLMNGEVPIGVISALAAQGPAKAGRIRALAVTSAQRVPSVPDWPTLGETLPGFSAAPNVFLVGPAGTPAPVVQKLSGALRGALASKEVEETFAKQGATLAPSSSPELARQIADEVKRWVGVVKEAGIKVE
jgi:tripartite-type tricarboxylate transporter receptor subunit TctC